MLPRLLHGSPWRKIRPIGLANFVDPPLAVFAPFCTTQGKSNSNSSISEDLLSRLKDPTLVHGDCLIGGERVNSTEASIEVLNPALNTKLATICSVGGAETKAAIAEAHSMLPIWSDMTATNRYTILKKWHDLIVDASEDLATIVTMEAGKPLLEAKVEVAAAAGSVGWMASEARRISGEVFEPPSRDRQMLTVKQPVGVVGAITPWNFPSSMVTRKVAPALAAGCTVVLKASELTPLSAIALCELAYRAGLPLGVLNLVFGDAKAIGHEILSADTVRKITFTGSTPVGKLLAQEAGKSVKRVSLELGGSAPLIVFNDADLELAVMGAARSGLRNAGQACTRADRIFVQEDLYDTFVKALSAEVSSLRVGYGMDLSTNVGPLITPQAVEKVEGHVEDGVAKGGVCVTGGKRADLPEPLNGNFFEPTVLKNATIDMRCFREETFGPLMPIFKFRREEEAVQMANNTDYGLAGFFYTSDLARAWRVSNQLEFGMVGVNEIAINSEVAPFGGMKQSGIGREQGRIGLEEYLETKYVCMGLGYGMKGLNVQEPVKKEVDEMG